MANYFGAIDLTLLGKIVKAHPELVKVSERNNHKYIGIDIYEKEQEDEYGNRASVKVSCKKENRKEDLKYYISNLKLSQFQGNNTQTETSTQSDTTSSEDDLPF